MDITSLVSYLIVMILYFVLARKECIDNEIQMKNYFNTKLQMTILIGTSIVALSMVAVYKNAVARYLLALMMFVLLIATRKNGYQN